MRNAGDQPVSAKTIEAAWSMTSVRNWPSVVIAIPRMTGPLHDIPRLPRTWRSSSAMGDGSGPASLDMDRGYMAVGKAARD